MRLRVAPRGSRPVLPTTSPRLHRLRRRLRAPSLYWTATAVTGALTAGVVWQFVTTAEHEARRYGDSVIVAVAARSLPAGAPLERGDVVMTRLPLAMVPSGAERTMPSHRTLRREVAKGEVLLAIRLAPAGASPASAVLRPTERAMAVPLPDAHLDLRPGDVVDAVSLTEDGTSEVIARGARVVAAHDRTAVIAIDEADLASLNDALAAGTVALALVGS